MEPESIAVTVETEPAPESTENPSIERTIGQLETETEHLTEEVEEAAETAEQAQSTAEAAIEIAIEANQSQWATQEMVEELRSEVRNLTAAFQALSEAEGDQDEIEQIQLPEETEAEPQAEVKTSRIPSWLI